MGFLEGIFRAPLTRIEGAPCKDLSRSLDSGLGVFWDV